MLTNTNKTEGGKKKNDGTVMVSESTENEPSVEHFISVMIPPECIDPDGGECAHSKHPVKKEYNPV